jgi:hypothetical protein
MSVCLAGERFAETGKWSRLCLFAGPASSDSLLAAFIVASLPRIGTGAAASFSRTGGGCNRMSWTVYLSTILRRDE